MPDPQTALLDRAAPEADLHAEIAALRAQLAAAHRDRDMARIRHHPLHVVSGEGGKTATAAAPDDRSIVARIITAYHAAGQSELSNDGSWWFNQIADIRGREHEVMARGDPAETARMLRDPQANNLFYGFDNLAKDLTPPGEGWADLQGALCYDSLLALAEAVGTVRLELPEAPLRTDIPDVEDLLRGLDQAFGFRIDFPNPFPGEVGLKTSRGIASYRCFQALFQAWRIAHLAPGGAIIEIGGGLGRTAYYTMRGGARAYAIVDLPLSGVAQAYFLHRVGIPVHLFGEGPDAGVRIMPPSQFHAETERCDLVVNVDSFTEMGADTVRRYIATSARRCGRLLSVNHEFNAHRMLETFRDHPAVAGASRTPYWLRRGYVEEVVDFHAAPRPGKDAVAS